MSTDRELLELAAKAAGFHPYIALYGWNDNGGINLDRNDEQEVWNPLQDDGDALRLSMKLEFDISCGMAGAVVDPLRNQPVIEEFDMNNPYAATRRAIVRAAAELGRRMP